MGPPRVGSVDRERLHRLLEEMRVAFLQELPDRCDGIESRLLRLEEKPDDLDTFNDLFRGVHSLKGSGGTHGLPIVTTICHQLETLLTDACTEAGFDRASVSRALAHVDLLREVRELATRERADYTEMDAKLATLRASTLQSRKAALLVESSPLMARVLETALAELPVQVTVAESGISALEHLIMRPFDFAVVGRELRDVNGVAVVCALRESQTINRSMPVVLVTANPENVPAHAGIDSVVPRDKRLPTALAAVVREMTRLAG